MTKLSPNSFTVCEKKTSLWLLIAAIFGFLGVVLGAFGAHALKGLLTERGSLAAWETAVKYQFVHALGLAFLSLWARNADASFGLCRWVARFWTVGIVLFSGSIYLLATLGWKWLGPITPLGGLCFLIGWALLAVVALKGLKTPENA